MFLLHRAEENDPDFDAEEDAENGNIEEDDESDYDDDILEQSLSSSKPINKQKTFLVFESKLLELMKYCAKCGAVINSSLTAERKNTGSQLMLIFHCVNGNYFVLHFIKDPAYEHK